MFLRNRFNVQIPGLGKEHFVPKESGSMEGVPMEQVSYSDSGKVFLRKVFLRKVFLRKVFLRNRFQVQFPGLRFHV
ncbi:hypothetical protein PCOAH_00019350 [Plasmodium coatneyi]|uniref:Uncharacterized protein n=1 Tax=Plasmodium coatneyi TaxID=208452 RepID=A0A1B1DYQ6_9APIC|nr:hypothetical protein PCOAH_00019350 [Plasmodium coatneyi]ANQ07870.1 hypothetical protein PCOAH_00019350 [Plasmodium coatneyi]